MKVHVLLFALISTVSIGESTEIKHSSTYESDNKWWKCNIDTSKGCVGGDLKNLNLTRAEEKYVADVLDKAPWSPRYTNSNNIISYFGVKPSINVGAKLIFENDAHGLCSGCGISVYLFKGRISMIHFYVPNKFILVRHDPSANK